MADSLTIAQRMRRDTRHRENYERQARYPKGTVRRSPRGNLPQGIPPTALVSCRVCAEHPEKHPNDFRYLYRRVGSPPVFLWLDSSGRTDRTTYPSVFQAVQDLVRKGWEDATW
jgi:hypothetical protein